MAHLQFSGDAGRELWRRIKDYLWLIDGAPKLHDLQGEERRKAEARIVAFFVCAAFGYGFRLDRYLFLSEHNRDIYKILYSSGEEDTVNIDTREGTHRLELGRVQGFSAVLPLTAEGLEAYRNNELAASQLTTPHLVPWPYLPHSVPYLLLAGAVYFRSIFEVEWLAFDSQKIQRATRLINRMLWQVSGFLPKVELFKDGGGAIRVRAEGDHSLPVLVCPITTLGRGEKMLVKLGFDIEGYDKWGNKKFVLDVSTINEAAAGRANVPHWRLTATQAAVELLRNCQRRWQGTWET
jgi:hypothetical protein